MLNRLAVIAAAVLVMRSLPALAQPTDCEPARCSPEVAQALAGCNCPTAGNHGLYVSCVARAVNKLAKDGVIPTNCKGKIRRCAARSVCGKEGFVTCDRPTSSCDLTTGLCADGVTPCTQDLDCGSRCSTKSSADHCTEVGGTPSTRASCCGDCAP